MSENTGAHPPSSVGAQTSRRQERWAAFQAQQQQQLQHHGAPAAVSGSANTGATSRRHRLLPDDNTALQADDNNNNNINESAAAVQDQSGVSDPNDTTSGKKSGKKKKGSSSGKKKSRGGDKENGSGTDNDTTTKKGEEAVNDAASRLEKDIEEQQRILSAEGVGHNPITVDWAARLADLTLLHSVDLDTALPYVSQSVISAMRRDVQAAQALHDDVRLLPLAEQRPQPLDYEEMARACAPPTSQLPITLSQRVVASMAAAYNSLGAERPIGLSGRNGEDGTEANELPPAAEIMRQAALYRSIVQDEFPCQGSSAAGSNPATASATSLILRGFRKSSVPRAHAEFVVDPIETKADDSVLMDASSARFVRRDEELLRQVVQEGAATTSSALNMFAFNSNSGSTSSRGRGGLDEESSHHHSFDINNNGDAGSEKNGGSTAATTTAGKRVITVNLGSLRIREHPDCSREHAFAHILLDAYTQYRMLTSNLLSGLKSRKHYEVIVEQLQRSLTRQQRVGAVAAAAEHQQQCGAALSSSRRPGQHQRVFSGGGGGGGGGAAPPSSSSVGGGSIEEQLLAEQLAIAKTKLSMSFEMEEHTLTTMWNAWKELVELWRGDAALAASNTNNNGQHLHQKVHMTFALTKRDDPEHTLYREEDGVRILDYVPHAVVQEPAHHILVVKKQGSAQQQQQQISASSLSAAAAVTCIDPVERQVYLQLYVKSSEAAGLKLVGETAPKRLDSVFGASFNETFELHVTREPQQMLIKVCLLHLDARNVQQRMAVATVSIPPSLTHAAHEIAFSTGEKFTGATDGMPHEVGGAVVVSTTWRTGTGLTVESIERMFLNGEADPLDPRNASLVVALRRHYQLRMSQRQISLLGGRSLHHAGGGVGGSADHSYNPNQQQPQLYLGSSMMMSGQKQPSSTSLLHIDRVLQPQPVMHDQRLQLLNLKWRIRSGQVSALAGFEKHIVRAAIPATSEAAALLARNVQQDVDEEQQEVAVAKTVDQAGASNPNEAGKAWLARIREKKLVSKPAPPTDADRLAKVMTLPTAWSVGDLGRYFKNWCAPHSGFNPQRKDRADLEAELESRDKVKEQYGASTITAHVMKANNLPVRGDGSPIRAFVELRFVDKAVCTQSQTGVAPSWFETLSVPFEPEDFEDDTLGFIDDDIVLGIYDELRVALPTTATTNPMSQVTHYRIERRYLGAVKIPFYTLYSSENASIEATFRIFQPRAALGYVLSPGAAMPTINLFVSLWPPLRKKGAGDQQGPDLSKIGSDVVMSPILREITGRALEWSSRASGAISSASSLQPKAAQRTVFPFAPASSRRLELMSRFLRADGINPPPGINTWEAAVRFVALFPFEVDLVTAADADEWATVPEFVHAGVGDYEELAITLCMLLRRLLPDTHCFLLTGMGDVYAQAVYVLIHINGDWRLIDPRTGDLFNTTDPMTGLSEVSMVISHNQIWANVQLSGSPYTMMWDLDDMQHWMPMLEAPAQRHALVSMVESLQPATMQWAPPAGDEEVARFEDDVRRAVKTALRQLRAAAFANGSAQTQRARAAAAEVVFQERVAVMLRDVLRCMEDERLINVNVPHFTVAEAMEHALQEFGLEYISVGSPVNRSVRKNETSSLVSQLGPLLDAVRETAVHEVGAQGARFAVAVHVRAYPAGLFSVWAFVCALVQRA